MFCEYQIFILVKGRKSGPTTFGALQIITLKLTCKENPATVNTITLIVLYHSLCNVIVPCVQKIIR